MEKKTIEQLLNMPAYEIGAYLQTLPEADRRTVIGELLEAVNDRMLKEMDDNPNNNVAADQDEHIKP